MTLLPQMTVFSLSLIVAVTVHTRRIPCYSLVQALSTSEQAEPHSMTWIYG